jgi:hypothetical protein
MILDVSYSMSIQISVRTHYFYFAYKIVRLVLLHLLGHLVKGNIEKSLTW